MASRAGSPLEGVWLQVIWWLLRGYMVQGGVSCQDPGMWRSGGCVADYVGFGACGSWMRLGCGRWFRCTDGMHLLKGCVRCRAFAQVVPARRAAHRKVPANQVATWPPCICSQDMCQADCNQGMCQVGCNLLYCFIRGCVRWVEMSGLLGLLQVDCICFPCVRRVAFFRYGLHLLQMSQVDCICAQAFGDVSCGLHSFQVKQLSRQRCVMWLAFAPGGLHFLQVCQMNGIWVRWICTQAFGDMSCGFHSIQVKQLSRQRCVMWLAFAPGGLHFLQVCRMSGIWVRWKVVAASVDVSLQGPSVSNTGISSGIVRKQSGRWQSDGR